MALLRMRGGTYMLTHVHLFVLPTVNRPYKLNIRTVLYCLPFCSVVLFMPPPQHAPPAVCWGGGGDATPLPLFGFGEVRICCILSSVDTCRKVLLKAFQAPLAPSHSCWGAFFYSSCCGLTSCGMLHAAWTEPAVGQHNPDTTQ
jgi:hypothetical protein